MWCLLQVPGLTARAWDNDGEFLLIEAAYALPKWVKPETSTNRVWLHKGALHLVPLPSTRSPTLPPAPSAAEALAIVAADSVPTKAGDRVQSALAAKLQVGGCVATAAGWSWALLARTLCAHSFRVVLVGFDAGQVIA